MRNEKSDYNYPNKYYNSRDEGNERNYQKNKNILSK